MAPDRKYSLVGRPFRLQLSLHAADGFDAPASRGRCQIPACPRFEWSNGVRYCREHWLVVYHQTKLPDRSGS